MEELHKIKLHEAIEQVLRKSDCPLDPIEIADKINILGIYHRRDGRQVPSSPISARANNYTSLFRVLEGKISLKNHS